MAKTIPKPNPNKKIDTEWYLKVEKQSGRKIPRVNLLSKLYKIRNGKEKT
jgi:hypothetical protein